MTRPLLQSLFDESERRPLSVTELTMQVRGALEARFGSVWVEGEISNFKAHASGHWYFTVKDEGAQLRATCFRGVNGRIRFRPSDGLQVRVRGRLSVYEPRGEYELIVEALDPVGAGALRVAFDQMRERLAREGLFDEELKRELPLLPRRVGIVTSPSGAALRDILTVLRRRARTVHVLFVPVRVQGEGASTEIARGVELLNSYHAKALREGRMDDTVDVLIVGRGGGSAEDLWAFNEERVARAVRSSLIPVISAVGHETDVSITDFAADVRAPTPSAAAEMVAAREDEMAAYLESLTRDLWQRTQLHLLDARTRVQEAAMSHGFDDVRARLRSSAQAVNEAAHRLETITTRRLQQIRRRADATLTRLAPASLNARVAAGRARFEVLSAEREAATRAIVEEARGRLLVAMTALDALSPLGVLQRGYALAQDGQGRLVREARQLAVGAPVRLRLASGALQCRVEKIEETENA